jgi:capsular polysaccharide export protein
MMAIPYLERFLGQPVAPARRLRRGAVHAYAGWGVKPSGETARALAQRAGVPMLHLEDGFLRSWGTGDRFPPLSVVVDELGIYYDSTRASSLEQMLASPKDLLEGIAPEVRRARDLVLRHRLSKYNHAPDWRDPPPATAGGKKVLVVDQTRGDLSVRLGSASEQTFLDMLSAARAEHPGAVVYVKTHPEVAAGRKGGYLTEIRDDACTVVLRQPINPMSLMEHMDHVYVVSSTMGFEALLAGRKVTCFGLPWYAGWGATDDRQACPRRQRRRSVDELFAAAYFHYTRYLDPVSHQRGTIFDVIDWLVRQREMGAQQLAADGAPGRLLCVGFRRWKAVNLRPMLNLDPRRTVFVHHAKAARALQPGPADRILYWGATPPPGVAQLCSETKAACVRLEDGFVRSVGLGSDLVRPLSLVLDSEGIYFDPSRPSALEQILNTADFQADELERALRVRQFVVEHGLTKYNVEPRMAPRWNTGGRRVVLVPGQVEDDASIRLGCGEIRTNLALLAAARAANPDACIVYKPHPDVASGNRRGKLALAAAREYADTVETVVSVVRCIEACDEVHTMTSLTGFDALLRGRKVVTYGQPFYAGWGLTDDRMREGAALARRQRRLTLDQLVAGTLLRYPLYWDWELKGYTSCEAVLRRITDIRVGLEASGGLEKLRIGFARRQWRKLGVLTRSWLGQW